MDNAKRPNAMMTITKRKIRGAKRLVELLPLLRDDKDDDNDADGGGIIVGTLCLSSY